jgi:Carboxypeptidase regulatory-like domain
MRHSQITTALGVLFLLCCMALVPGGLRAQYPKQAKELPGGLEGTVVNAKDAPVADAQILWQPADGGRPHVLHSDANGHFRIAKLRPGLYELRASAEGVSSEWSHNVVVRAHGQTSISLKLSQHPTSEQAPRQALTPASH